MTHLIGMGFWNPYVYPLFAIAPNCHLKALFWFFYTPLSTFESQMIMAVLIYAQIGFWNLYVYQKFAIGPNRNLNATYLSEVCSGLKYAFDSLIIQTSNSNSQPNKFKRQFVFWNYSESVLLVLRRIIVIITVFTPFSLKSTVFLILIRLSWNNIINFRYVLPTTSMYVQFTY